MSKPETINDLYVDEMQDLWSANDQMKSVVQKMADAATCEKLSSKLKASAEGIEKNNEVLKELIGEAGGDVEKEHCKGMEGLVTEAKKHALESGAEGAILDAAIIAQYNRMAHYGIAGYGTAKAYAEALERKDAAHKLDDALEKVYQHDDMLSDLSERCCLERAEEVKREAAA